MDTCKTFHSPEAAAAFMLGFRLASSGVDCDVRIDCEEPETVLVDLNDAAAEGAWFDVVEQFKSDFSVNQGVS
ncbi:MAG: hypothetical protein IT426_21145 [Pirellulales bacterium]|nr:hypothetical protein [Pirellulales bacterium]